MAPVATNVHYNEFLKWIHNCEKYDRKKLFVAIVNGSTVKRTFYTYMLTVNATYKI